jgi:NADH dehydrogenase FAD-containing subunit
MNPGTVLIVGGGFSGIAASRILAEEFREVVLADYKKYFEYTPGILRKVVDPKPLQSITIPFKDMNLPHNVRFVQGEVSDLTRSRATITRKNTVIYIDFNYVLVCSGSDYIEPLRPSKLADESKKERERNMKECRVDVEHAKSILVVGAGVVGVELVGEIASSYPNKEVTLMTNKDVILHGKSEMTQFYAEKYLRSKGVLIKYKTTFQEEIVQQYDMVFKCYGIGFRPYFLMQNFGDYLDNRGRIIVNEYMQMVENIFAAGDCSRTKYSLDCSMWIAEELGRLAAGNIINHSLNRRMTSLREMPTVYLISLGEECGILQVGSLVVGGVFPNIIKAIVQTLKLNEVRNKWIGKIWYMISSTTTKLARWFIFAN